jgi:hypothetical protein
MRRNKSSIFMCAMAVLFVSQAQAAYRDMKQEIETYSPPSYFQDLTRPSPEREKPVRDSDFDAERQKIEELKSQWLKALSTADTGPVFFRPDGQLLK